MKAYTDIEQSKKLAEILPIKSADMRFCFSHTLDGRITGHYPMIGREPSMGTIPCWSLAALISILPDEIKHDGIVNNLWITSEDASYYSKEYDSYLYYEEGCTIDACYKLILKLHELKKL